MPAFRKRQIFSWAGPTVVDTPQVRHYFGDPQAPHHTQAEKCRCSCDGCCSEDGTQLPLTLVVELL